jgi:hypothetical protein
MEPWLSIIGGGLAAALVTIVFNVWWDKKKQQSAEDWEFRRYHANQIHFATAGLMEVFFAAKTELYFLSSTLEVLVTDLNQLAAQADATVRLQSKPEMTVTEFESKKAELLLPFQTYNAQQIALRWNQFEQKTKDLQAKAEAHISVLQPLIPASVFDQLQTFYSKFSGRWQWDLPHAQERLRLYEASVPELSRIRAQLTKEIEVKLGRS